MIIAITGNNGSGKTEIAKKLTAILNKKRKKAIHVEEFNYILLGLFKKVLGDKREIYAQDAPLINARNIIVEKLLPYAVWFDLLIQRLYQILFHNNKIIVKDRYIYDFLISWKELGNSNALIEFMYNQLLPQPKLTFFLEVDPEIAHKRRKKQRKTYEVSFYHMKAKLYEEFLHEKKVIKVNNGGLINNAVNEIYKYIHLRNTLQKIDSIVISGIDGAGKTTTISHLSSFFKDLNIEHKIVHFYYRYTLLKLIKKIKKIKKVNKREKNKKSKEHEKKSKNSKSKIWAVFVLTDAGIQYLFTKFSQRKNIIIYDRFFYDYIVSFKFLNVDINNKKLMQYIPHIDKSFIIVAAPDKLYKRKEEHTKEFYRECYEEYRNLSKQLKVKFIDTTEDTERETYNKILNNLI